MAMDVRRLLRNSSLRDIDSSRLVWDVGKLRSTCSDIGWLWGKFVDHAALLPTNSAVPSFVLFVLVLVVSPCLSIAREGYPSKNGDPGCSYYIFFFNVGSGKNN